MAASLTEFIQSYLSVLGLTGDELDEYTNKVLVTGMSKALLSLELTDSEKAALEAELKEAQENPERAIGALDRALPEGRQTQLLGSAIAESLMELADSLKDSLEKEKAKKLAAIVDAFAE